MHIDLYIVLGGAIVGLLVGMTGAGGGALMTPMLILIFGVAPTAAISSDLVASVVMRPIGAAVHWRAGTVHRRLVMLLATGSIPSAFAGSYVLHLMGDSKADVKQIEAVLGIALLLGAAAMALRYVLDRRAGAARRGLIHQISARPLPTVLIGVAGGLIVGMTSVGAGSLMIILLLFLYPSISANQLVGTDLAQAVPLTLAAAVGALVFGHVEFGLTTSLIVGSVPAVFVGSLLSSRVPDRFVRPVIAIVILASGLKYVGLAPLTLVWVTAGVTALAAGVLALETRSRGAGRRADRPFVQGA